MRKMDDSNGVVPESGKLIGIAANLLCDGDFSGCRKFAVFARDYDPSNPIAHQLLAVADVMLASKAQDPTDWCSVLQLTRPDSATNCQLIRAQCAKFASLLDPKVNGFPYSDAALRLVKRAWYELSKNTRVGNGFFPEQEETERNAGETFWTVCPFCYAMFEYKKEFEDCCLRCQVCRRAFHGVAIKPPAPEIMVKGKEQYYFTYGCFEMKYYDGEKRKKDTEGNKKKDEGIATVEISDDDEEEKEDVGKNVSGVVKFWSEGNLPAKRMKAPARRIKETKSKLKMAATDKRMGNGMSRKVGLASDVNVKDLDLNGECGNEIGDGEMGEVRFF